MKRLGPVFLLVAIALAVAGCGSSSKSSTSAPTTTTMATFNAADVTFAQSMIPHHQQAVEMAAMASSHQAGTKVLALAKRIQAAQGPEIAKMTGWLKMWGKPIASSSDGMGSMGSSDAGSSADSGGMPMGSGTGGMVAGMMTSTDMTSLGHAHGANFDKMFLTMMIRHHQGALTMANAELTNGKDPSAKALAKTIIAGQTKEIAEMKAMLNGY